MTVWKIDYRTVTTGKSGSVPFRETKYRDALRTFAALPPCRQNHNVRVLLFINTNNNKRYTTVVNACGRPRYNDTGCLTAVKMSRFIPCFFSLVFYTSHVRRRVEVIKNIFKKPTAKHAMTCFPPLPPGSQTTTGGTELISLYRRCTARRPAVRWFRAALTFLISRSVRCSRGLGSFPDSL